MSDEAAFLRGILAAPADDAPRLVYADWLDEQDDPRGAYLRAEAAWARTGRREKALRTLAAALDPVWVARVSRPPIGICADKIAMRTSRAPATTADLDAAEAQLELTFPAEFRALLLNWNGAWPAVSQPPQPPRFRYGISEVTRFLPLLRAGKKRSGRDYQDGDVVEAARVYLASENEDLPGRPAPQLNDYIPLAHGGEGDYYLIGVRGTVVGKVAFFHDFTHNSGDPDHLGVVAPSLGQLLASMVVAAPEWYRHVVNGDRAALLAWLDAGGDVNAHDAERHESLLTTAMSRHDVGMVRELLSRGAKVNRDARELAGLLSGATGRKIRDAVTAAKPAPKKKGKQ